MENKKIILGILLALSMIILILLIRVVYTGNAIKDETIKVGVISSMTGPGSYQGQEELRGLEIAKDEINSKGGINGKDIELIVEDSQTSPDKAVSSMNKLTEIDNAKFIIGDSWTATTASLVPIADEKQVILISPATVLDSLSKDDMFFRTVPNTDDIMKVLAEYSYYNLGSRKVAVLYQNNEYGKEHTDDFKKYFENLGGEVVDEESILLTQKDVRTELSKIKEKDPDTIFNLHATGAMQGIPLQQAKELGINVKWIGSYGTENTPLIKDYGNLSDGFVYPYFYDLNAKDYETQSFIEKYNIKYNETPTFTSANSYDALRILAKAVEKSGEDPLKVKKYLLNVKDYKGASGTFSFDKNGDVKKHIFIKQIQNGKFVRLTA